MNEYLDSFFDFIGNEVELDDDTRLLISRHCRLVRVARGELFLNNGQVCNDVYFIVEGRGVSYFTDTKGKTTTWFFHFNSPDAQVKNIFAVDYRSFLSDRPSDLSIQATSEIIAIHLTKRQIELLTEGSDILETWIAKLNEKSLIMAYNRIATLLIFSATERYEQLLRDEPYLLDLFSNYHIATYLNITPQSLSRIRARLSKKGVGLGPGKSK